jgi:hypothetical protein
MSDVDDYGDWQSPEGGYGDNQQPGTLYADKGTVAPKPPPAKTGTSAPSTPKVGPTTSVIHVSVNPASKIKLGAFVDLINKSPGIVTEFKGKIKRDKKTNTIVVPDYSQNKVVSGKEWLFDLGKAGDDWEITTATLLVGLDGPTSMTFEEDLGGEDERGRPTSSDPDDSLLKPSRDFTGSPAVGTGLALALTVPTQAMVNKNPSLANVQPRPQIARLKSGKGLIMIARQVKVGKGGKVTKDGVTIPKPLLAMTFFHELSAHASFFQLGQDANHGEPNVDRNAKQAEESYQKANVKDIAVMEKNVQRLIDGMREAVP